MLEIVVGRAGERRGGGGSKEIGRGRGEGMIHRRWKQFKGDGPRVSAKFIATPIN